MTTAIIVSVMHTVFFWFSRQICIYLVNYVKTRDVKKEWVVMLKPLAIHIEYIMRIRDAHFNTCMNCSFSYSLLVLLLFDIYAHTHQNLMFTISIRNECICTLYIYTFLMFSIFVFNLSYSSTVCTLQHKYQYDSWTHLFINAFCYFVLVLWVSVIELVPLDAISNQSDN